MFICLCLDMLSNLPVSSWEKVSLHVPATEMQQLCILHRHSSSKASVGGISEFALSVAEGCDYLPFFDASIILHSNKTKVENYVMELFHVKIQLKDN